MLPYKNIHSRWECSFSVFFKLQRFNPPVAGWGKTGFEVS